MCSPNCCCKNLTTDGLRKSLISFIVITLIVSAIAIFIRAGNTERYKKALIYLEERNNGAYESLTLDNCRKGGLFDDEDYCEIDGKFLYKPSENVSNQGIFKKWKDIELALNIVRAIIILIFLIYYFIVINEKLNKMISGINQMHNNQNEFEREKAKINSYLSNLIIIFSFLIALCGIYILLRALALTANMDIGLYEEGNQNSFESCTAINYIIDIVDIILFGIAIGFVLRLKGIINKIQQKQPLKTLPYNPNQRPKQTGRRFLPPMARPPPQNSGIVFNVQVSNTNIVHQNIAFQNHQYNNNYY